VWGNKDDPHPSNDTATSTVQVTPGTEPVYDLVLRKLVDRHAARRGQRLRYTITVTNKGPRLGHRREADRHPRAAATGALDPRGQGNCQTGPPLTCTHGTLRSGPGPSSDSCFPTMQ
jgi:hypothetical protein